MQQDLIESKYDNINFFHWYSLLRAIIVTNYRVPLGTCTKISHIGHLRVLITRLIHLATSHFINGFELIKKRTVLFFHATNLAVPSKIYSTPYSKLLCKFQGPDTRTIYWWKNNGRVETPVSGARANKSSVLVYHIADIFSLSRTDKVSHPRPTTTLFS